MRFQISLYFGLFLPIIAFAQCVQKPSGDWMDKAVPPNMPVRPPDCAVANQTPPDFSWPHAGRNVRYTLRVVSVTGVARSVKTSSNWHSWNEPFAKGDYTWWVEAQHSDGSVLKSATRRFVIPEGVTTFTLPTVSQLWQLTAQTPHPRGLPSGAAWDGLVAELQGSRKEAFDRLLKRVDDYSNVALPGEPTTDTKRIADRSEQVRAIQAMWKMMNVEETRILESAFAAAVTGKPARIDSAVKRLMNIAAWDPAGATSYPSQFQVTRSIIRTLAAGYDWLFPHLTASQRRQFLNAINARMPALADSVIGTKRAMEENPANSVGVTNLGVVASVATLVAGDLPEAETWFSEAVPLYANLLWPWGGDDGGYANGMHYAMWEIADAWPVFDVLRNGVGLDLAGKAYARNFSRTLLYFSPPGTAQGVFGDGAEQRMGHVYSRYLKAYAQRVPTDEMRWLAPLMTGEDSSDLALLSGPPLAQSSSSAVFANDHLIRSVGWAAMHSNLKARDRTSIYFKSSPFGTVSHTHGDQNALVVIAGGQPLLLDSGYYDWYGSPHSKGWYRQTVAHNAVTFDGGVGQRMNDATAIGTIQHFTAAPTYTVVQGNAARAYDDKTVKAQRTVVFIKPDKIIIHDRLGATVPRTWELNFHTAEEASWRDGRLAFANAAVKACAHVWPEKLEFFQRRGFEPPPQLPQYDAQWHTVFRLPEPLATTDFVMVIDVGCNRSEVPSVKQSNSGIHVDVDEAQVNIPFNGTPVVAIKPVAPAKPN